MSDARIVPGATRPRVRLERRLPDPPAVVWAALTEREQLRAWFPSDVVVAGGRWAPGAAITFAFDGWDMTLHGEVLEVDEPRRLVFTWGDETLTFELSPADDGGTHLVLLDELPPGIAARNAAGWDECLDRLAGAEPAAGGWRSRFDRYVAAFEPELGRQEGPPDGAPGAA
jgi:uncharacterized protein YndB with AHSA1/START domain